MRIRPSPFSLKPQPPAPPTVTKELLGWTFTRPIDGRFDVEKYPGYWAMHLAEIAQLVYADESYVRDNLPADCTSIQWFDHKSTQAVGYLHEGYACLVFRGTQERPDWAIDATSILWGAPPRHLGFHRAWRYVEPDVVQWLQTLPPHTGLIIAGHSLGGALAILSAFELSATNTICAVQTFGAPRVGAMEFRLAYNRSLASVTRQFRYGADVVTIVPPPPIFVHVSSGTRIKAAVTASELQAVMPSWAVFAGAFNSSEIPASFFARDPIIAIVLLVLSFIVFATNAMDYTFAHLPAWVSHFAHSRFHEAFLIALSIPLVVQLTYLIPIKIPFFLRCLLSTAIVAAIVFFHVNILWIVPTLVWIFMIGILLLRALLPSGEDHKMAGYITALYRPFRDDIVFHPSQPNKDLYTRLRLR
jgi:pimeloyl-ACP methyl ester carboxylesterase